MAAAKAECDMSPFPQRTEEARRPVRSVEETMKLLKIRIVVSVPPHIELFTRELTKRRLTRKNSAPGSERRY